MKYLIQTADSSKRSLNSKRSSMVARKSPLTPLPITKKRADPVNQNHEIQNGIKTSRFPLSCTKPTELNRYFVGLFHFRRFLRAFRTCGKNPELYHTTPNAFKTPPNVICFWIFQYWQQWCIYPLDSMPNHIPRTPCGRIRDNSGKCSKNQDFTTARK